VFPTFRQQLSDGEEIVLQHAAQLLRAGVLLERPALPVSLRVGAVEVTQILGALGGAVPGGVAHFVEQVIQKASRLRNGLAGLVDELTLYIGQARLRGVYAVSAELPPLKWCAPASTADEEKDGRSDEGQDDDGAYDSEQYVVVHGSSSF